MRRTDRLFDIIQLFRPGGLIKGAEIAEKLEVSLRTIYRDIDTLVAAGVPIEGERGVGYILREPIFLPPLTLSEDELAALQLGVGIVQKSGGTDLAEAADGLLGKINAVLPTERRGKDYLTSVELFPAGAFDAPNLATLNAAIETRQRLRIAYQALNNQTSTRTIRPLHIEYWGRVWTLTCWCELRDSFRAFRIDRICECTMTGDSFDAEDGKTYADYISQMTG